MESGPPNTTRGRAACAWYFGRFRGFCGRYFFFDGFGFASLRFFRQDPSALRERGCVPPPCSRTWGIGPARLSATCHLPSLRGNLTTSL